VPINIAMLPHFAEIDDPKISAAAKKYAEAQQALRDRQKAVAKLVDSREQAEWDDAAEAEAALAAGKPAPRRRHVAEHDKMIDQLQHDLRVAQLAQTRALRALQETVDAHGDEWCRSLSDKVTTLDEAWPKALEALAELHRDRVAAHRKAKIAGASVEPIGAVRLLPGQLHGIDVAYVPDPEQRANLKAIVAVEDVLDSMQRMQEPETRIKVGLTAEIAAPAFEHAADIQRDYAEAKQRALPGTAPTAPGYDRGQAVLDAAQNVAPDRLDKAEARRAELLKVNG
jgi:hypothetical protein